MLDAIRKRKENWVFTFLIMMVAAVMAFYGVGQMGSDKNGPTIAARVNGEIITTVEFRRELERRLMQYQAVLGNQYDERLLTALRVPQKTLDELVKFKLLAQQARKMNVLVPDAELADYIRALPMYQKNGKFDSQLYAQVPNRGLEEKNQREHLLVAKLYRYLSERAHFTPHEIKQAFELKNTKVELQYAKIDFELLSPKQQPGNNAVEKFIKDTPEPELQQYYNMRIRDFTDKARIHVRQIRAAVPFQASAVQKDAAKTKIDEAAKKVTAANFAEMAKTLSDDEYAKKGGDLGWVDKGSLDPAMEKAIDSLKQGEVSVPVETGTGFYIVQLVEKKDAITRPFAAVKKDVSERMVTDKMRKDYAEQKRKEWDTLLAAGKSIESELKKARIEIKKTGLFSLGQGHIPQIGAADNIVDATFELTPDKPLCKKLLAYQDRYFFIKMIALEKPKEADFAKEKESVETTLASQAQNEVLEQWLTSLQKQAVVKTELNFKEGDEAPLAQN